MTPQRARDVERICQAALEQEPSARAAFLGEACAGDDDLRRDVESLLAHESGATGFLSTPAVAVADRLSGSSPSLIGGRVGSYQVLALIDAGGMGEVYRARDTKLGRDVAIKVLPRIFTSDPERRRGSNAKRGHSRR
jgi:eukaryotic-like serine/threonine-protein kinase